MICTIFQKWLKKCSHNSQSLMFLLMDYFSMLMRDSMQKSSGNMCRRMGVFANVAFNHRAGGGECYLFDDILYKERYSIERTNAWLDSYRSLSNRFDVTLTSWQACNYIAFIVILMKKVKKKQKSR